jgi:hypothetical protein
MLRKALKNGHWSLVIGHWGKEKKMEFPISNKEYRMSKGRKIEGLKGRSYEDEKMREGRWRRPYSISGILK